MTPKYSNIKVVLVGEDDNAFAILARVEMALRKAEVPEDEIKAFYENATSGDYDHLLQVVMQTVDV